MVAPNSSLMPKMSAKAWKSKASAGTRASQKFLFFKRTDQLMFFILYFLLFLSYRLLVIKVLSSLTSSLKTLTCSAKTSMALFCSSWLSKRLLAEALNSLRFSMSFSMMVFLFSSFVARSLIERYRPKTGIRDSPNCKMNLSYPGISTPFYSLGIVQGKAAPTPASSSEPPVLNSDTDWPSYVKSLLTCTNTRLPSPYFSS